MLILTRKPGESFRIEDTVVVTVLEVRGSQVKLGIIAPPEIRVNREEVFLRQRAEMGITTEVPQPPAWTDTRYRERQESHRRQPRWRRYRVKH